jgi:hypothetical protein
MWFSDELDKDLESKYEKRICEILKVPIEFVPKIKKTLNEKSMNLERFLELWEFCNEFDEETYFQLYKKLFRDIYYINPRINPIIDMSCLIFWKLFDHIVENQYHFKITSQKDRNINENYQLSTNLYQNKNKYNILAGYFSLYKYFIDISFYNNIYRIDPELYDYFNENEIIFQSKKSIPFFFKKTYFRYLLNKLKNHTKLIGKLLSYYHKILEKRYQPGGIGYYEAENNWYNNAVY